MSPLCAIPSYGSENINPLDVEFSSIQDSSNSICSGVICFVVSSNNFKADLFIVPILFTNSRYKSSILIQSGVVLSGVFTF